MALAKYQPIFTRARWILLVYVSWREQAAARGASRLFFFFFFFFFFWGVSGIRETYAKYAPAAWVFGKPREGKVRFVRVLQSPSLPLPLKSRVCRCLQSVPSPWKYHHLWPRVEPLFLIQHCHRHRWAVKRQSERFQRWGREDDEQANESDSFPDPVELAMSKHKRKAPRQSQLKLKIKGKDSAVQMARTDVLPIWKASRWEKTLTKHSQTPASLFLAWRFDLYPKVFLKGYERLSKVRQLCTTSTTSDRLSYPLRKTLG